MSKSAKAWLRFRKSCDWLEHQQHKYAGLWVAISGDNVIAYGATRAALDEKLRQIPKHNGWLIIRAQGADERPIDEHTAALRNLLEQTRAELWAARRKQEELNRRAMLAESRLHKLNERTRRRLKGLRSRLKEVRVERLELRQTKRAILRLMMNERCYRCYSKACGLDPGSPRPLGNMVDNLIMRHLHHRGMRHIVSRIKALAKGIGAGWNGHHNQP